MALAILDAGVVIAILDPADGFHSAATAAFRELAAAPGAHVALPISAYAEVMVHPERAGADAADSARTFCTTLLRIQPLTVAAAEEAARLRARHLSLRLPDALVIATARVLDADELLTTDGRWLAYHSKVRVL